MLMMNDPVVIVSVAANACLGDEKLKKKKDNPAIKKKNTGTTYLSFNLTRKD
jgi:hypothetical protein